jgi:hypothetical protein
MDEATEKGFGRKKKGKGCGVPFLTAIVIVFGMLAGFISLMIIL